MKKDSLVIAGLVSVLSVLSLVPSGGVNESLVATVNYATPAPEPVKAPPPRILAKSALAFDLSSEKIIFEKNQKTVLPLASLTKIVSALALMERLDGREAVKINNEHFTVRDLLAFVMVESSNDAIEALVEHLEAPDFLELMYEEARKYGANSMMFYNATGLDITNGDGVPARAGAFGSAEDVMNIVKGSLDSELWQYGRITEVRSIEGKLHILKPTNVLAEELNLLIGAKTGFTDLAGGNLLVIVQYPPGQTIAIVVLGSTEEGRFTDVKAIFDWYKNI